MSAKDGYFPDYDEFTTFNNLPDCSAVQTLPFNQRCDYVSAECTERESLANYMHFLYCVLSPKSNFAQFMGAIFLLIFIAVFFALLAVVADKFFVPGLKIISIKLGLSEHLAGVTLLAFGNGAPDLFTSWVAATEPKKLHFSDLMGSSFYVLAFVGGLICLLYPFQLQPNNFTRDVLFFIFSIFFIDYVIVSDGGVTFIESLAIMSVYVGFITVLVIDALFIKIHIKMLEAKTLDSADYQRNVRRLTELHGQDTLEYYSVNTRNSVDVRLTRTVINQAKNGPNEGLMKQFRQSINPIDEYEWQNALLFKRLYLLMRAPFLFLLAITLPVVDYDLPAHGWSKLLNCIQFVTFPFLVLYGLCYDRYSLGFPIAVWTLIPTVPLAIALFFTSRTDLPPKFHFVFVIFEVAGAVLMIYFVANETVEILHVFGLVTTASNAFLGATLLAWGNGMGDLVSNLTLARHGYRKMAFAACIGGPFFNTLVSMGITFIIKIIKEGGGEGVVINSGVFGENNKIFMLLILFSTLFIALSTNFMARRSTGAFMVIMYGLFLIYAFLAEVELIQTYASQAGDGLN